MKIGRLIFILISILTTKAYSTEKMAISDHSKKEIVSALVANEKLHASFFRYDAREVESNAKNLLSKISKIKHEDVLLKLNIANKKLLDIKAVNTREANNQAYHLVSLSLISVINTYELGKDYKAYQCPMLKMKWVQNSTKKMKVNNPYAPHMPHCGAMIQRK